jgi:hypothetical protein
MEPMKEEFKKEVLVMAKARGLDLAEDAAGDLAELALDIISFIIDKSENSYDDLIWVAVESKVREVLAKLVDKIDGMEG